MALYDLGQAMLGLIVLLAAGDVLVRGAAALSLRLGVPPLIIGLTVIAFGTSAPELLIAIQSVIEGAPDLAFGNVVGSNIANVLLVLGLPAILKPFDAGDGDSRRNYLLMIAATVIFFAFAEAGPFDLWQGVALLGLLGAMLYDAFGVAKRARADGEASDEIVTLQPVWIAACLIGGVIGLPLGAHFLIEGAQGLARDFGVSEAVIGLTLVAIGTSLPELATTIMAALRGHAAVAVGNVIGSNLFNIVAVMGLASFFGPIYAPEAFLSFDLWVMLGASLLLAPFIWRIAGMGRVVGAMFLAAYGLYLAMAVVN